MNWYVIYTKPKWEKKVAEQLNKRGVTAYCPLTVQMRQWTDRKKKVEVPLFNSYVFVQIEEVDRNQVFDVSGVVRYLFWLGKPAIVRDDEIELIKKSVTSNTISEVVVESYQKGDRITVDSGIFKDQIGVVKEVSNKEFVLVLETMGCILKIKYK